MIIKYITCIGLSLLLLQGCTEKQKPVNETISISPKDNAEFIELRGLAFSNKETGLTTPRRVNGTVEFIVESGTKVKKGDLLVKIKSSNQSKQMKKSKNRLFYAKRKLKNQKEQAAKEQLKLELAVLEKQFAYTIKKIEIEYKSGEKDKRVIQSLDLKTKLLDEKLINLSEKMESYQSLAKLNSISVDEIEKMKKELASTKLNRDLQELDKKDQVQGVIGQDKDQLLLELDLLNHDLKKAKLALSEKIKLFPLDIEKRELVVKKRQAGLKKIAQTIKQSSLHSKVDGVFVRVKHPWNGNYIEKGVQVWRGMSVGKVLDYVNISVKFRLPEKFVDLVQPGMKLSFYSLQNPDKILEAKVKKIDSIATPLDPVNRKANKFHWMFIESELKDSKFLPSETFVCKIELNNYKNSIFVPKEFAKVADGQLHINTKNGLIKTKDFVKGLDYFILKDQNKTLDIDYAL
ncbi:MAG: HlyD family efflux transporter periplasmic adaptor subunit [Candidatus Cloacimonetes bacterium]|nr:HlyD family efflux transporter periplasmic adaptor subunit [Candidatus Cloacimonadota bacterium]